MKGNITLLRTAGENVTGTKSNTDKSCCTNDFKFKLTIAGCSTPVLSAGALTCVAVYISVHTAQGTVFEKMGNITDFIVSFFGRGDLKVVFCCPSVYV